MSGRPRRLLLMGAIGLAAVVFALLMPDLTARGHDTPITNPNDFRAFYCGGASVDAGRDPYRTQPLLACELAVLRANSLPLGDRQVIPAPLPPYALALFGLLAHLPFLAASMIWAFAGIFAISAAAILMTRLTDFRLGLTAAIMAPVVVSTSLHLGQIVPVVVCALCGAALSLRHRRHGLAAAALACAMIEPHVALPAFIATALFVPAMRRPLVVSAGFLMALSLAAVGPAVCLEYGARVLPLHARSEVVNYGAQYSLTSLLWAFGVDKELALRIGEFSYAFFAIGGLALAHRLARHCSDEALLVLMPPAFVLIAGVFMHVQQMVVALPFAMLLSRYVRGSRGARTAIFVAIVSLAIPWEPISELPFIADRLPRTAASTIVVLPPQRPEELAELPWTHFIEAVVARYGHSVWADTIIKLPTWIGLALVLGVAFGVANNRAVCREPLWGEDKMRSVAG
jgi:hypothetical protein